MQLRTGCMHNAVWARAARAAAAGAARCPARDSMTRPPMRMLARRLLHAQALLCSCSANVASKATAPAGTGAEFFVDALHGDDGASGGTPTYFR